MESADHFQQLLTKSITQLCMQEVMFDDSVQINGTIQFIIDSNREHLFTLNDVVKIKHENDDLSTTSHCLELSTSSDIRKFNTIQTDIQADIGQIEHCEISTSTSQNVQCNNIDDQQLGSNDSKTYTLDSLTDNNECSNDADKNDGEDDDDEAVTTVIYLVDNESGLIEQAGLASAMSGLIQSGDMSGRLADTVSSLVQSGDMSGLTVEEIGQEELDTYIKMDQSHQEDGIPGSIDELTYLQAEAFDQLNDLQQNVQADNNTHVTSYKCRVGLCEFECDDMTTMVAHTLKHKESHVESGKAVHVCKTCGETYTSAAFFRSHLSTHNAERPFKCILCEEGFALKAGLTGHMRQHHNVSTVSEDGGKKKEFCCDLCGMTFAYNSALKRHVMSVHKEDKPFRCHICHRGYQDQGGLTVHMRSHTGEKPFKCDVCDKGFVTNARLIGHSRMHTGERPFQCVDCGKTYAHKSHLATHIATHADKPSKHCTLCGKGFFSNRALTLHHQNSHSDKQYVCTICGKAFSQNFVLTTHMRTHTGEKPYACLVCNRNFRFSAALRKHKSTHEEKVIHCEICNKSFARLEYFYTHNKNKHGITRTRENDLIDGSAVMQDGSATMHDGATAVQEMNFELVQNELGHSELVVQNELGHSELVVQNELGHSELVVAPLSQYEHTEYILG